MLNFNTLQKTIANNPVVRIVMIDDDEDDYLLTTDLLNEIPGRQFEVQWLGTHAQAFQLVKTATTAPDIFFFDYRLGAKNSVDLISTVHARWPDVPIVVLTGKGDRRVDQEAMQAGATDYLVKTELDTDKLERCIRYALERAATLRILRRNEAKYHRIFEETQTMISVVNAEGRIIDVNPAATALLGYSKEEFLAMPKRNIFFHPEQRDNFIRILMGKGEIREFEAVLRTRSGEVRQCLLSAVLQKSEVEENHYNIMVQDITARRRAELVRLLSEKIATIDRFVRVLAHEVRNPLTNIDLSIEQLDNENNDPEHVELIEIIKRNSKRIGGLITELLQVSRKPDLHKKPVHVRQILLESLDAAADRARLKNISVQLDWPKEDLLLNADAPKIQMALLNLFTNAFESMEEGEGVLTVGYGRFGAECCITVEDNGCGIPKENLGRLFDPYFTGKQKGMGLGLTTVLNIVQSHGGMIAVDSQSNRGTRFEVWLPLAEQG